MENTIIARMSSTELDAKQDELEKMERKCIQIKSLSNFLGAYSHLHEDASKDESFFLKLL